MRLGGAGGAPMERMEVEPSGGGGALRRSNSAPLLPGPGGTPQKKEEPLGPPRSRRSSICLDSGLGAEAMREAPPGVWGGWSSRAPPGGLLGSSPSPGTSYGYSGSPSAVAPHSGHLQRLPTSPSRRTPPRQETLKRKGGLDIDSPPKKLFVAGVSITPPAP